MEEEKLEPTEEVVDETTTPEETEVVSEDSAE